MITDKPEEAMTFGELLALIAEQQRRLTVLETAFTSLTLSLDAPAVQLLAQNLTQEAQNQQHDASLQQQFFRLAKTLRQRTDPLSAEAQP
ncbi:hypothetical protein DBY66_002950 [Pantoea sp. RIT413]|uniref:hypothetical protein n=1 Tax=Pantoea sp. RIT413 TaxID=2202162 RepID=UPI000D38FD82|nr:hypothetical protein [Pantoea sp. RIT 413]RAU34858.1 hypothetical protein DBY66_002950 [Pantoea sp. RIT 413]